MRRKRGRKRCEHKTFKDIFWLLLPPVLTQPVLGPWRHLLIYISFFSSTGNGRVMCSWPCSPPLSLSISFPSSVSLGYAAIWLFIAAWAELLDISFGIWFWFSDFSVTLLHFPYVSFMPPEPLLCECTLSFCILHTFMFPLCPRTSQHSCLVSIIFIPFFSHVSLLPVSTGSTIPLWNSELRVGISLPPALIPSTLDSGSRQWPQRRCWRRKAKAQTITEEVHSALKAFKVQH